MSVVQSVLAEPARASSRRIERVDKNEPHTLVLKLGGASACLRFNETICASELLAYVEGQMSWQVSGLPFVVDGVRYEAAQAAGVALSPTTARVAVGQESQPTIFEVTRNVGAKG